MSSNRAEFIASMEFGQCSVVSSDVNKIAHEVAINQGFADDRKLYFLGEDEENARACLVVALTPLLTLSSGREAQIVLSKSKGPEAEDVRICAVTRGDVALPLVSFGRRKTSSECDYVQIGQEMTDESFVVTPPDAKTRKDLIETAKTLLTEGPRQTAGRELMQEVHKPLVDLIREVGQHVKWGTIVKKRAPLLVITINMLSLRKLFMVQPFL